MTRAFRLTLFGQMLRTPPTYSTLRACGYEGKLNWYAVCNTSSHRGGGKGRRGGSRKPSVPHAGRAGSNPVPGTVYRLPSMARQRAGHPRSLFCCSEWLHAGTCGKRPCSPSSLPLSLAVAQDKACSLRPCTAPGRNGLGDFCLSPVHPSSHYLSSALPHGPQASRLACTGQKTMHEPAIHFVPLPSGTGQSRWRPSPRRGFGREKPVRLLPLKPISHSRPSSQAPRGFRHSPRGTC